MHYGFLIAPCRVRTPQHKGKVEQGGVHYVTRNFLGGREPTLITRANRRVEVRTAVEIEVKGERSEFIEATAGSGNP
jgi:transposase